MYGGDSAGRDGPSNRQVSRLSEGPIGAAAAAAPSPQAHARQSACSAASIATRALWTNARQKAASAIGSPRARPRTSRMTAAAGRNGIYPHRDPAAARTRSK